jgi:hypothetical protein
MMAEKLHHRRRAPPLTTGLKYGRKAASGAVPDDGHEHEQKGLVVLATHRLVGGIEDFRPQQFLLDLKSHGFTVMKFGSAPDAAAKEQAKQMLRC